MLCPEDTEAENDYGAFRENQFQLLGRLYQVYLVNKWSRIFDQRLEWIRRNQCQVLNEEADKQKDKDENQNKRGERNLNGHDEREQGSRYNLLAWNVDEVGDHRFQAALQHVTGATFEYSQTAQEQTIAAMEYQNVPNA